MIDSDSSTKLPDAAAIELGHEPDAPNVRVLSLAIAGLVLLSVMGIVVSWAVITLLGRGWAAQLADEAPPLEGLPAIRAPLDPAQSAELRELQAWEAQTLSGYSWVDRDAGVAAIPIQRAIELVSERGLPGWPSSQPSETGSESP